jgi:hypothetical protein
MPHHVLEVPISKAQPTPQIVGPPTCPRCEAEIYPMRGEIDRCFECGWREGYQH